MTQPKPHTYWLIWFVLLSATVAYLFVGTMAFEVEEVGAIINSALLLACAVAAGIALLVSLAVRFVLVPQLLRNESQMALPMFIVALVIAESAAITGLMLRFLGAPVGVLMAFSGIAMFVIGIQAPLFTKKPEATLRRMPEPTRRE